DLPQRLVLRAGSFLQRDQGARAAAGLCGQARAVGCRASRAAAARARRGDPLPAHPPGRLAQRAARRAGQAEGPARVSPQAALPSDGEERARLRDRLKRDSRVAEGRVTIHTDGACSGNPGPGGYGAILQWGGHTRELKGGEPHTTNNRMELMAAIVALETLKRPCTVDIHTDSQYLRNGIMTWINGWKSNGSQTSDKKPVKNAELWH